MYYPKSQIKTGLYTNGGEYVIKSTLEDFIGYYYKLSTGKLYAGENPQGFGQIEIILPPESDSIESAYIPENVRVALWDSDPDPVLAVDSSLNNTRLIVAYSSLVKIKTETRALPSPYYSQENITDEESLIGEYQRYFAKKTNELMYMEISKETYTKFINRDSKVAYDLYNCLSLPWSLGGNSEITNRNIVAITERKNKWYGFSQYLKFDSGGSTNGGEFKLPNGSEYIGPYHMMSNGTFMTGESHGEGNDIILTPISLTSTTGGGGTVGGGGGGGY